MSGASAQAGSPGEVEFIGLVATQGFSEIIPASGPPIDIGYTEELARAHEEAGFDRVLIDWGARWPDGFQVANHIVRATERLKMLVAQRPGFIQPTVAARQAVTFDHLTGGGRLALHMITGGDEADQHRDGDYVDHDRRYHRTAEYMSILRRLWASRDPADFNGEFYKFEDAYLPVLPVTPGGIPLYFGGLSAPAMEVGPNHADVYVVLPEPRERLAERVGALKEAAARADRTLELRIAIRVILGPTEEAAWELARDMARKAATMGKDLFGGRPGIQTGGKKTAVGTRLIKELADEGDVLDERLWTGMIKATGMGHGAALVGTPEQVAESFRAYMDLGIGGFLIRGFDPIGDVRLIGQELIPLIRAESTRSAAVA